MSDKIWINGFYVREKEGQYGPFLNVSIDINQLIEQAKTHAPNGTLNVVISKRREKSTKGITHSVALDTYRRENADRQFENAKQAVDAAPEPVPPGDDSDVPF